LSSVGGDTYNFNIGNISISNITNSEVNISIGQDGVIHRSTASRLREGVDPQREGEMTKAPSGKLFRFISEEPRGMLSVFLDHSKAVIDSVVSNNSCLFFLTLKSIELG
jgi:hypothetical protein